MKVAVITATIGEPRRRSIYTPHVIGHGVEYHCFSDRPVRYRRPWKLHLVERTDEPAVIQAKRFKILAHQHIDADAIVWVDGHCRMVCNPVEQFAKFSEGLALVEHARCCVFHEVRACIKHGKDDADRLRAVSHRIRHRLKHPSRWGLWYGGFLMRRITEETNELMEAWWKAIAETTVRDQISLPVVLRKSGMKFHSIARRERPALFRIMGK